MSFSRLTYRCPHCGTPLELEAQATDQLLSCPSPACGKPFKAEVPTATPLNAIIVPNDLRPELEQASAQSPMPLAQPAADREEAIEVVHLDMWRRYPFRCLGYSTLAVVGLAGVLWFALAGRVFLALLFALPLGFALYRLIPWWLRMRQTTVTITTKRCLIKVGMHSQESENLALDHVTNVHVNQGLLSRFLNVGDIVLSTDDGGAKQIMLMAVPDPERVADHIRTRH